MNLLQAAESIIRSKMDKHGFIMNSCLHDQKTENLNKFLSALDSYQSALAQYEIIQGLKNQEPATAPEEVLNQPSNEDT
tara:strand:+ start:74 stop:310 length:237 start_codon:yes stop_codon:yes gene_type:complete